MTNRAPRLSTLTRSARLERAKALAPRLLFMGAVAITSLVGLRTLAHPVTTVDSRATSQTDSTPFEDFAQAYARVYLTYDGQHLSRRERALRPFLPGGMDADAGLIPPAGESQRVVFTRIAGVAGGRGEERLVTVAAVVGRRTVYLAVPVASGHRGALELAGYPAIVAPPDRARPALPVLEDVADPAVRQVAARAVRNYLGGATLNLRADLAPGASLAPLDAALSVRSVDQVAWADASQSGDVAVTVEAADSRGAVWTLTYDVGLERAQGRVAVTFIETHANRSLGGPR